MVALPWHSCPAFLLVDFGDGYHTLNYVDDLARSHLEALKRYMRRVAHQMGCRFWLRPVAEVERHWLLKNFDEWRELEDHLHGAPCPTFVCPAWAGWFFKLHERSELAIDCLRWLARQTPPMQLWYPPQGGLGWWGGSFPAPQTVAYPFGAWSRHALSQTVARLPAAGHPAVSEGVAAQKADSQPGDVGAAQPAEPPASMSHNAEGTAKSKRSTERGEGRLKLIAALTKHHQYADGGCLNLEPVGCNELAKAAGVSPSTASAFFNDKFQGHTKYKALCRDAGKLTTALKLLNDEFAPYYLLGAASSNLAAPEQDDADSD
jgi:hypothetical protein